MNIEKFKNRLADFNNNDDVIEWLETCQREQFASPHWLGEAVLSLDGLYKLAEEMIKYMEFQHDQET